MQPVMELPPTFIHQPPENHSYEVSPFKRNIVSIWILNYTHFNYTDKFPVRSIWGFFNTKTGTYSAPINATKCGDPVDIKDTTPYTAMQLNLSPLERAFL